MLEVVNMKYFRGKILIDSTQSKSLEIDKVIKADSIVHGWMSDKPLFAL